MSPNLASRHHEFGTTLIFAGRPEEGVAALEKSVRLDPRHPRSEMRLNQMALGLYFSRDHAAAAEVAKRAIRSYPDYPNPYRWLAAALGQLGRVEEAKRALQEAIAVVLDSFQSYVRERGPWTRPEDHAHLLEGLRKAGWLDT
jgi:adenylate cyclase